MAGENVTSVADAAKEKGGEGRQRSTIGFPYNDLDSVVEMAQAIHNHVGMGECEDDQLAAWTDQSPKSSGYRTQASAARMFGVIESPSSGSYRLSQLGRQIVDPKTARQARAKAFLNVPLYSAVYEKYKGGMIPPAAALERDMEGLGVATKMKDRARRIFERSAQQAGFFEHGKDRLVMPGVSSEVDEEEGRTGSDEMKGGTGNSGGGGSRHPFIEGLLQTLPDPSSESNWPLAQRIKWLQTAANIFDLMYKGEGGIEVRAAAADRSPRPSGN